MKNLLRCNIVKLIQAARTCRKFCMFGIENLIKIDKNLEKCHLSGFSYLARACATCLIDWKKITI